MYPWLRVMYAVVEIGSRMRRSACGMILSTFCPCANAAGAASTAAMTSAPIAAAIECDSEERLSIGKSPGTSAGGAYAAKHHQGGRTDSLRERHFQCPADTERTAGTAAVRTIFLVASARYIVAHP